MIEQLVLGVRVARSGCVPRDPNYCLQGASARKRRVASIDDATWWHWA